MYERCTYLSCIPERQNSVIKASLLFRTCVGIVVCGLLVLYLLPPCVEILLHYIIVEILSYMHHFRK